LEVARLLGARLEERRRDTPIVDLARERERRR